MWHCLIVHKVLPVRYRPRDMVVGLQIVILNKILEKILQGQNQILGWYDFGSWDMNIQNFQPCGQSIFRMALTFFYKPRSPRSETSTKHISQSRSDAPWFSLFTTLSKDE